MARDARGFQQCAETRPAVGDARSDGAGAEDALERHWRPRRGARQADRRDRTAAEESRGIPAPRNPSGQGLFALWSARNRQNLAGQGGGARLGRQFHLDKILGPVVEKISQERTTDTAPCKEHGRESL